MTYMLLNSSYMYLNTQYQNVMVNGERFAVFAVSALPTDHANCEINFVSQKQTLLVFWLSS